MMPQFSIRTLLLVVALAAACLTIHRLYQRWYVQNYALHAAHSMLGTQVHNGDTFQTITRLFEQAVKVDLSNDENENVRYLWNYKGWMILPGDEIWHFEYSHGQGAWLQFRDGRVVNFQPRDFADPEGNAKANRAPVPPRCLRRGVWPFCVAIFVVGSCLLVLMDRRARPAAERA